MSMRGRPTRLRLSPAHDLLLTAALGRGDRARAAWERWRGQADLDTIDPPTVEMMPLLAANLGRLEVDDVMVERLLGITRQSWYRNQLLIDAVVSATHRLHEAGIDTMVTGGTAVAIMAYPDLGLRNLGRAGLALRETSATRAAAHLVAAGWSAGATDRDLAVLTDRRGLQVFLTDHVLTDHPDDGADAPFWEGCHDQVVAERTVPAPALTDTVLLALLEGLRHGRPVELRWIGDTAIAINHHGDRIDWDRLVDVSRRLERSLRVEAGLAFLARTLQVPVPTPVLAALGDGTHSRRERAEHRLWLRGSPGSRPSALIRHWYRYRRSQHDDGNVVGFGRYARRRVQSRSRP